ncbi:MAG: ferredoxin-thioredoxin reductase variable chain [Alkalinema sp. FL-bin-369]|nr:ferredoxin-thioredoxin reductase variable chain [Leptolyngbyaceae cyanobacterium LF-bin-369]
MEVGTRIRVSTSVMIYHHPEQRNIAFDLKGQEGEIIAIATSWQGRPVSANYPYVVKFSPKLKTHLTEHEIESIS